MAALIINGNTTVASGSYGPVSVTGGATISEASGQTVTFDSVTESPGITGVNFDASGSSHLTLDGVIATAPTALNIGDGGTIELGSNISGHSGVIAFSPGDNNSVLIFDPGVANSSLDPITLFANGDTIDVSAQISSINYNSSHDQLTVNLADGSAEILNVVIAQNQSFSFAGSDILATCFAAGSRIDTPSGPVAVEDLKPGDTVLLATGMTRPVKWIGWRHIQVQRHIDPDAVCPIRIKAHAIAEGAPRHDLLVSPDHAIFIDGKLIPARLLRNGATIVEAREVDTVTYFHVELDAHDVLLAEGLATESYLDTGNRASFQNAGLPLLMHADFNGPGGQARREAASCAPLACDAARVEPIWRSIAQRAEARGLITASVETTDDPELCILAGGKRIAPLNRAGGRYTFMVPSSAGDVRLSSRTAKPSVLRPWIEDRRSLGVMVRQVLVKTGQDHETIAMDDPRLTDGWWAAEGDSVAIWRWTAGDAALPIKHGPAVIEVMVGDVQSYPIESADHAGSALRDCA
ncbi:Hint domain-containing protein [Rhodopila sp.]|uniref:Hint domain-containing protein n=1 Tax=Rhodopila sp. TaxID=2480087 RepID=UPI003D0DC01E